MSQRYGSMDRTVNDTQLSNLITRINGNLQTIRSITQNLEDLTSILGGPRDNPAKQDEIQKQVKKAKELLDITKNLFEQCARMGNANSLTMKKVKVEYERVVQKYSEAQRKCVGRLGQIAEEARVSRLHRASDFNESTERLNENDFNQVQSQEEDDQNLILEQQTEERMRELQKNLVDVQEMFTELNQVVVDSRPMVDEIETNVEVANQDVEKGNEQLNNAVIYKKSAFKKKIIIAIVVLVILIIIGIIIGVEVHNDKN